MTISNTFQHRSGIWNRGKFNRFSGDLASNPLVQLLRFEANPGFQPPPLPSISQNLDSFESISDQARYHGLDAFVLRMLNRLDWARYLSAKENHRLFQRNLLHYQHLAQLTQSFTQLKTAFAINPGMIIPLKGIYLANTLYKDTKDRQFGDIDLLVSPDLLALVVNHLKKTGYISDPFRTQWERKNPDILTHHLPPFRRDLVAIELHTRLLPDPYPQWVQEFRESAQPIPGSSVLALPDPLHHLLFLIAHLDKHVQHGRAPWRLYRDLALLTGHLSPVWPAVKDLADGFGLTDPVLRIQDELNQLYDWKVFHKGQHAIPKSRHPHPLSPFNRVLKRVPGIGVKLWVIWRWMFPPVPYVAFHHPGYTSIQLILWYITRPIRILTWLPALTSRVFRRIYFFQSGIFG